MLALTKKSSRRAIIAWFLFDWAISPFSVLITTFIFATYFTEKVAINKIIGTTQWGEVAGLAGFIVAIFSPIFGAIADSQGRRKPWLKISVPIIVVASAALWFVKPETDYVVWALFWVALGTMAIEFSTLFYNAMLNELAPPSFLGRLSGWGWGAGYAGGLVALILALNLFVLKGGAWLGLHSIDASIRICGPLVAIWVITFSWPLFVFTPDRPSTDINLIQATRTSLRSLGDMLQLLRQQYKNILIFLIARMLYIDGLITVFAFGGIYAAGVFNMSMTEVIQFGIGMNIAAGIGAALLGWMDDARGPKLTILCALLLMIVCGVGILLVKSKLLFWILGMGLSLGVGPTQAASRSLLIRISPPELITELFGFYNFSGRATSFVGPWILGLVTALFNNQRAGMSTVFFFMAAGGLLLLFVNPKRAT